MSYRFMRVIVFFDLPTISLEDKREYRNFRKIFAEEGICHDAGKCVQQISVKYNGS